MIIVIGMCCILWVFFIILYSPLTLASIPFVGMKMVKFYNRSNILVEKWNFYKRALFDKEFDVNSKYYCLDYTKPQ